MEEKLFFYYTNDLHSNFMQWPHVAAFMKDKQSARKVRNESYWMFDIGDHVDRVHPISEAFMGKANVKLLNDLNYDIVTIGNNEGITLSHEDLFHLYDDANFEVVCSNLYSLKQQQPKWLKRTVEIQSIHGVRIGVIGLTAPFNDYYELLDWHVSHDFMEIDKYVRELKDKTDIIILLSHLGINEDREIARSYKDIDVIIGGHTHHLLRTGEVVNNTLITAAGKHCASVGQVILTWDFKRQKLTNKEAYATNITDYQKDVQTEQKIRTLEEEAIHELSDTVISIGKPIEVKWFKHTKIMQELTNTLKQHTKAEIAMLNSGLLLDGLKAGNITYKDIHQICPHPINPVVVKLTGSELVEVIRASLTKDFMELQLKGFGFRGKVLGRMIFSGINVETDFHSDGVEYVKGVNLESGASIEKHKEYTVATADTFTFGRLLPEIARSETKRYFLPEFLRDLLADTLRSNFG